MKHIRIYIALLLMAVMNSVSVAQIVSPVDFMRNNPRWNFSNPALFVNDDGFFDLALGGITLGVQNIGLKYDNFFQFNNSGQPVAIDLNQGIESLRDVNYLNEYFNIDIFNCGRRTAHGYFTYTHRLREFMSFSYNKDLVQLIAQGNAAFLGEDNPANLDLGLSMRLFQEFDFGYQMCLTDHLNIGLRFKFLMGAANVETNMLNIKLYTDPETYALTLVPEADINASLPLQLNEGPLDGGNLFVDKHFNPASLFKNYGYGIDLGAEYVINDQFGIAAAINDLGRIKWNTYTSNLSGGLQDAGSFYQNGGFYFPGLTSAQVDGMMHDSHYAGALVDSLTNYLQLNASNLESYTTSLFTNYMIRAYFDLTPGSRFSAQFGGYNMGQGIQKGFTFAYTGSLADKYDLVVAYTTLPGSTDNLGVGLNANLGGLHLYVATNNLLGFFNPANTSQLGVQFGLSFTSGEKSTRAETVVITDRVAEVEAAEEETESESETEYYYNY